jgi:hypothetical protein
MQNPPLSPDDLFRYYQRGALDANSLMTNLLLNLIELHENQKAYTVLQEMMSEALRGLSLDVDVLARRTGTPRPSQMGRTDAQTGDQNGLVGPEDGPDIV